MENTQNSHKCFMATSLDMLCSPCELPHGVQALIAGVQITGYAANKVGCREEGIIQAAQSGLNCGF